MAKVTKSGLALLALTVVAFTATDGWAFCVQNQTATTLFARSLDSTKFQVNIGPGEQQCCSDCINRSRGQTTLLIVSGYVPISKNSQPGWQGECRVDTDQDGKITVTGSKSKLTCQ
ncbi:MAG: hypothetical protein HQL70_00935 [Magnetococcales bacterium]|nr:hypothetical protein [Magnetococcales bacterium]